jgi:predicted DNA-binding transcriptional regulator YafY
MNSIPQGSTQLPKLYRVFRLIQLLSAPPYYTAKQLSERLGVSKKTVYNYLRLLEDIGMEPDVNKQHQHFLPLERRRNLPEGLGVDEAKYLQETLWQMPDEDPRRNQLLLWLNKQYAVGPIIENLTRYTPAEHRTSLTRAIEDKLRIRLINYRDAKGRISNRYGEPVAFQQNYTYIYVYDLDRKDYRQFRLDRIGYVEVTAHPIENDHVQAIPDIFGWTGSTWYHLRLELSNRGKQLLLEEYPAARPYVVTTSDGRHHAELNVKGFPGVGRWVLGLCAEVKVLPVGDGEAFCRYLNEKWSPFYSSGD